MRPPIIPQRISSPAGVVGIEMGAAPLGIPLVNNVNHLLGVRMGALRHLWVSAESESGTARAYIHRHPNCDYLIFSFHAELDDTSVSGTITCQAGSGASTVLTISSDGMHEIVVPWGGSGELEITYTTSGLEILSASVFDAIRSDLDSSDLRSSLVDTTNIRAGIGFGYSIISANEGSILDITNGISSAKENHRPTIAQATLLGTGAGVDSTAWTNPFNPQIWHPSLPAWADGTYKAFARLYITSGTYEWAVTTGEGSSASATLTNTVAGWQTLAGSIDVGVDDYVEIEMRRVSGTGTIYLTDFTVIGQ